MTPLTLEGTAVDLDAEGFFRRPEEWTPELAPEIARGAGIEELTPRHWQVIDYMRATYLRTGSAPTIRTLGKASGVPVKELYQLFPKGPAKLAAKIAGIPKPRGCIKEADMIDNVAIVISKGPLEGIYPGLIMANGARMEGIDASVFFTFFGLDAIRKDRQAHIKVATVGNPGKHIPTLVGAIPGMSALATRMMGRQMEKLDIPPIPEFVELISDSGAGLYACKASVDMFKLGPYDFVPFVDGILTVGEFYELARGGEIVFT